MASPKRSGGDNLRKGRATASISIQSSQVVCQQDIIGVKLFLGNPQGRFFSPPPSAILMVIAAFFAFSFVMPLFYRSHSHRMCSSWVLSIVLVVKPLLSRHFCLASPN